MPSRPVNKDNVIRIFVVDYEMRSYTHIPGHYSSFDRVDIQTLVERAVIERAVENNKTFYMDIEIIDWNKYVLLTLEKITHTTDLYNLTRSDIFGE